MIASWEAFAGYLSVGGTRHSGPRIKANCELLADPTLIAAVGCAAKSEGTQQNESQAPNAPPDASAEFAEV